MDPSVWNSLPDANKRMILGALPQPAVIDPSLRNPSLRRQEPRDNRLDGPQGEPYPDGNNRNMTAGSSLHL